MPILHKNVEYTADEQAQLKAGIWFNPAEGQYVFDGLCPHCEDGPVYVTGSEATLPEPAKYGRSDDGLYVACRCMQDHGVTDEPDKKLTNCGRSVKGLKNT